MTDLPSSHVCKPDHPLVEIEELLLSHVVVRVEDRLLDRSGVPQLRAAVRRASSQKTARSSSWQSSLEVFAFAIYSGGGILGFCGSFGLTTRA